MTGKLKGQVKCFNAIKGYGFIEKEGTDYFVHFSDIKIDGYKTLTPGSEVLFIVVQSQKGPHAAGVELK